MNTFYNTKRVLSEEDIIQFETKYHFVIPPKIKIYFEEIDIWKIFIQTNKFTFNDNKYKKQH